MGDEHGPTRGTHSSRWFAVLAILLAVSGILLLWLSLELTRRDAALEQARGMKESVESVASAVFGYPRVPGEGPPEILSPHRESFERGLASYDRRGDARRVRALKIKLEHTFDGYVALAEEILRLRDEQAALSPLVLERRNRVQRLILQGASDGTLSDLLEADVASGAEIAPLITLLQKSQVLANQERGELERFDSLRSSLLSDLDEGLEEKASAPEWMLWGSTGLLLSLAFGSAVLAVKSRSEPGREAPADAGSPDPADDQRDWMISTLIHELRNPLSPILNAVNVLEADPPADPRIMQLRDIIGRQARHLERLIDDLLDVFRIRRGLIDLKLEKMDLVDLVRENAADYEGLLAEGKLRLELDLPDRPVWISADRARIRQVIGNLLQNSAKFTNPGDEVQLTLKQYGPHAVLELRDTGIGMGQSTLNTVFEPFRQGKRSALRGNTGLGLGLSLVKRIVELHGGDVQATSKGKEQGSEFVVRLPLAGSTAGNGS